MTTFASSRAKARAMPRPIPLPPPVMMAILLERRIAHLLPQTMQRAQWKQFMGLHGCHVYRGRKILFHSMKRSGSHLSEESQSVRAELRWRGYGCHERG